MYMHAFLGDINVPNLHIRDSWSRSWFFRHWIQDCFS